jgi:hypothetical protein
MILGLHYTNEHLIWVIYDMRSIDHLHYCNIHYHIIALAEQCPKPSVILLYCSLNHYSLMSQFSLSMISSPIYCIVVCLKPSEPTTKNGFSYTTAWFHVFFAQCHKPSPRSTSMISPKNPPQMVALCIFYRFFMALPRKTPCFNTWWQQQPSPGGNKFSRVLRSTLTQVPCSRSCKMLKDHLKRPQLRVSELLWSS